MPASYLTIPTINYVQKICNWQTSNFYLGFFHRIPRQIVLGRGHIDAETNGMKLDTLVYHVGSDTMLWKTMSMIINCIQLIVGTSEPLFESNEACSISLYIVNYDHNQCKHQCTLRFATIESNTKVYNSNYCDIQAGTTLELVYYICNASGTIPNPDFLKSPVEKSSWTTSHHHPG